MPTKMIVTDLDGSLLRTDKTISGYTASVFHRCREKGVILDSEYITRFLEFAKEQDIAICVTFLEKYYPSPG